MTNEKPSPRAAIEPSQQVSGPAIGLLVTGIIGAIFSVVALISISIGTGIGTLVDYDFAEEYVNLYEGAAGMGSAFVGILVAAFIIYAALKMKDLTQYGIAMAASILAMIPCISPCCLIGLPIGIWCLVVLTKPEVKAAFH
ncbi:MAG: hypothetical protein GTO17_02765 [Candidatus Aminicenantes bacterium]|nr:hypothetical protein [Candidatus Aminicenantes bacterium]